MSKTRVDLIGRKTGMLTVLEDRGFVNGRHMWLCKCDCGALKIVYHSHITGGIQKSCGCLFHRKGSSHPSWIGYGEISGDIWWNIRKKYKRRNKEIEFSITVEQAWELFLQQNKKCTLTGIELSFGEGVKGRGKTASLDRIDSKKGYTIDNVQWVHKDINWMKNKFPQNYFIEMCKKVAERASL